MAHNLASPFKDAHWSFCGLIMSKSAQQTLQQKLEMTVLMTNSYTSPAHSQPMRIQVNPKPVVWEFVSIRLTAWLDQHS